MNTTDDTEVKATPLHRLHAELGGRMTPFAGWDLPVRYDEVIAEHTWCRISAALFDVSHMGIVELRLDDSPPGPTGEELALTVEALTPAALTTLGTNRQRYCLLTNDDGGVIDDCMITRRGDHLVIVVNAARRDVDLAHLRASLPAVQVVERTDLAMLALQGPQAAAVMARLAPDAAQLVFLDHIVTDLDLGPATADHDGGRVEGVGVSRSGYTGEDGFELMVPAADAERLARALLAHPEVKPAGLGARDTLRLEAGLHLYGNDLDASTSPIEAGLAWTVPKRRRAEGGFPGAERILSELEHGPARVRVGLRPAGRRPVRDGAGLRIPDGDPAGVVTSGGFGPTVGAPVAMGYVRAGLDDTGRTLVADVRGSDVVVEIATLPFVPHRYHRG
jgi:aminomethyltransferase